ncbi:hypothetical protein FRX31_020444 [Thalictrum thalictroides]|uniref:Uncharacterized protein n=1 Tax=Thalictrum thalictroides TaxID=46969 RepID=A0A7J6VXY4_THATH|nr:hypothetical protein FRX31_020444 [Thalictrum thalictroides]
MKIVRQHCGIPKLMCLTLQSHGGTEDILNDMMYDDSAPMFGDDNRSPNLTFDLNKSPKSPIVTFDFNLDVSPREHYSPAPLNSLEQHLNDEMYDDSQPMFGPYSTPDSTPNGTNIPDLNTHPEEMNDHPADMNEQEIDFHEYEADVDDNKNQHPTDINGKPADRNGHPADMPNLMAKHDNSSMQNSKQWLKMSDCVSSTTVPASLNP